MCLPYAHGHKTTHWTVVLSPLKKTDSPSLRSSQLSLVPQCRVQAQWASSPPFRTRMLSSLSLCGQPQLLWVPEYTTQSCSEDTIWPWSSKNSGSYNSSHPLFQNDLWAFWQRGGIQASCLWLNTPQTLILCSPISWEFLCLGDWSRRITSLRRVWATEPDFV